MATPLVAGNWKMNASLAEARELAGSLKESIGDLPSVVSVLCPPFPYLELVRRGVEGSCIMVGAQNMHYEAKGAFTGEVSAAMLAELCDFVILGHSERRALFGETDRGVNLKVKAALRAGLRPIVCVGETLEQRQDGQADAVVRSQLLGALEGVEEPSALAIAYEPVWAIGTGVAATPGTAAEVMGGVVRRVLASLYGDAAAGGVPLLYGGSVTAANVEGFVAQESIHGALVGGASLRAAEFAEIVRVTARVKGAG